MYFGLSVVDDFHDFCIVSGRCLGRYNFGHLPFNVSFSIRKLCVKSQLYIQSILSKFFYGRFGKMIGSCEGSSNLFWCAWLNSAHQLPLQPSLATHPTKTVYFWIWSFSKRLCFRLLNKFSYKGLSFLKGSCYIFARSAYFWTPAIS